MPSFSWKTDTIPFTPKLQARLTQDGKIKPEEGLFQLTDGVGKPVMIHGGSVYWNNYRECWIMIGVQSFGTSLLGEVWYAEAEELVGPCGQTRERSQRTRNTASTIPSSTQCSTRTAAA